MRRQPQLSLEELLHFRWQLGGALALLSIGTLFYLEPTMWPFAVLASGAILGCLLQPSLPGRLPAWVGRLGVPLITVIFAVDVALHEMIPAFVRLNVLLVLHRAVSYRTRRDDLQLVVLCLFLIIVTGVLTVSLVFVGQILLFTGLTMVFLFVVNIVHAATGDEPVPPASWARISRRRLFRRLWEVFDARLVALGAVLFLTVVGVSSLIFLSIPRFEMDNALRLLALNRASALTGFSEKIELGSVTDITQDNSIAMRVDVRGDGAVPPEPYWRMVVLDAYAQGTFRVSTSVIRQLGVRTEPVIDFVPPPARRGAPRPAAGSPRYVVFLEPGISRYLPLPSTYETLRFPERRDVQNNPLFGTLSLPNYSATLVTYQMDGATFAGAIADPGFTPAAGRGTPADYPGTTLQVAVGEQARGFLEDTVRTLTGGRRLPPAEFAARACAHLAQNHRYSLVNSLAPDTGDGDPVVRWMRAGTPGNCEFFAAAFTLLARTAGHPTRAITGFKGGTWNAYENYFMVRNSDAHAWCEIFDGHGAWLRVDPTPGAGGIDTGADPAAARVLAADRSVNAYVDSLRMLWYRRIVSFDRQTQLDLAATLRGAGSRSAGWLRDRVTAAWMDFRAWTHRPWTLHSSGDLLFLALLLFIATRVMKRYGIGTRDLLFWLRSGESATRSQAGDLLRRVRLRLAEPPRRGRFDAGAAREVERQLCLIRFGRPGQWPPPLLVFRAARRLL